MKIAVVTDDGNKICQHFGRASHFLVAEIEEGQVVNKELREKLGHNQFVQENEHENDHDHNQGSGMNAASHNKHQRMADAIKDCEVVICGGMGMGAYHSMQSLGIKPYVTEISDIEEALQSYIVWQLKRSNRNAALIFAELILMTCVLGAQVIFYS
jgi:predicted Fe-Mo cluster-binding NifX family protein